MVVVQCAPRTCMRISSHQILSCTSAFLFIQIHNGHSNNNGFLHDYCDGLNCHNHSLFSVRKDSLQLFFYYDDVEICNPLGLNGPSTIAS